MNQGYERLPERVLALNGTIKSDAKYYLGKKNVRLLLLLGAVYSCFAICVPVIVIESVMVALSKFEWEYMIPLQNVMMFLSIMIGEFLFFPGVYCGMYRILLKSSLGIEPNASDLLYFYSSPSLYRRSLKIYFSGAWYVFLVLTYLLLTQVAFGALTGMQDEAFKMQILGSIDSALTTVLLVSAVIMLIKRRHVFLFIPYAVENTAVSIKGCKLASKQVRSDAYAGALKHDFEFTFFSLILSVCTVGLCFIIYAGPMMVSRKVSFYRNTMYNKFIIYKD